MGAEIHSSYGICFSKFYIPPQFCKAGSGFRSESDLDLHKKKLDPDLQNMIADIQPCFLQ